MRYSMSSLFIDYECMLCGEACRGWTVDVDPQDFQSILARLVRMPSEEREPYGFEIRHNQAGKIVSASIRRTDGRCCFLRADNLCFLHARWGEEAKPAVCRSYPFYAIQTPDVTYVNGFASCTAIRKSLTRTEPAVPVVPPDRIAAETLLEADPVRAPLVRLSPLRFLKWEDFYFVQERICSLGPDLRHSLSAFCMRALSCPDEIAGRSFLEDAFAEPSSVRPFGLSVDFAALCTAFSLCFGPVRTDRPFPFAFGQLLASMKIRPDDPKATQRYLEYLSERLPDRASKAVENHLRARLFISARYFSHSVVEALRFHLLVADLVYLLALAALGNGPKLSEAHLLDAVYAVEKHLFHSRRLERISLQPRLQAQNAALDI